MIKIAAMENEIAADSFHIQIPVGFQCIFAL